MFEQFKENLRLARETGETAREGARSAGAAWRKATPMKREVWLLAASALKIKGSLLADKNQPQVCCRRAKCLATHCRMLSSSCYGAQNGHKQPAGELAFHIRFFTVGVDRQGRGEDHEVAEFLALCWPYSSHTVRLAGAIRSLRPTGCGHPVLGTPDRPPFLLRCKTRHDRARPSAEIA